MSRVIPPGSTLGVLGSGQLGRMFAIAARRLGYRVHVLSPDDDTPTGQVADVELNVPYDDLEAVARFAHQVDVVTFEFENVPAATTEVAARFAPVRPSGQLLYNTQNRLREKTFLREAGLPVTPFAPVNSLGQLQAALAQLGCPAVLKTSAWGYDGKGQTVIDRPEQAAAVWAGFGAQEGILEAFVRFQRELSVVAVQGLDGQFAYYGPLANTHRHHILDLSVWPAGVAPRIEAEAVEISRAVVRRLELVGVLCVELFLTDDDRLLVNELAPRPHNSGHLTIDAHVSCQFEQQVRAVCGLSLASCRPLSPAAMANLLGDLWQQGPPDWPAACRFPEVKLHLYGKRQPRPGRKMGHLTALADTAEQAARCALDARAALRARGG